MSVTRGLLAGLFTMLLFALPAAAADRAIIILDGSGSMWAQIDGVARISIARETLDSVLGSVPDDLELGFMSYGHREKGSCDDIELLVEPAAGTAGAISEAAAAISPRGKTPISAAVKLAAEDLQFTENKATVILITDGIETCEADPCALASELEAAGVDFTTHVVGFGLSDEEGQQVACLARNTGGQYLQAKDAGALAEALTTTFAAVEQPSAEPLAAPEPEPVAAAFNFEPEAVLAEGADPLPDDSGNAWEMYKANADGTQGEYVTTDYGNGYKANLEPGDYFVVAKLGEVKVSQPVSIAAGAVAKPIFVLNAGTIIIRPRPSEGAEVDSGAAVVFALPDGGETTYYGAVTLVLPAGDREVRVSIGTGKVTETIALAAGDVIERDIIVGVGRLAANAFYVEGMKVEDGNLFVEIFEAKKAIDGSRKSMSYAYGPDSGHDLPPGDYVLVAKMGEAVAEMPFAVKAGELTEVNALLGAGVLVITAPGYDFVEVFGAKKDIQGDRKAFGYGYGGALQTTLPAGDYVVLAHTPDSSTTKEAAVTVIAGEQTELAVE